MIIWVICRKVCDTSTHNVPDFFQEDLCLLIRLIPRTVVRLGSLVGSRWGGFVMGPVGKRTMRPRLRELVLLRNA